MPASIRFKRGVIPAMLSPNIEWAMARAAELHFEMFQKPLTITSLADGKHSANSLHYPRERTQWTCAAFDFRMGYRWGYTDQERRDFCKALRILLGDAFDVVDETSHVHVEFDPK